MSNPVGEVKSLVSQMHEELTEASISLKIMTGIRNPATLDTLNRYRGFFLPTLIAHRDRFAIKVRNVVDKELKGPNLHRVWTIIDNDPDLCKATDTVSLRSRLESLKTVLGRVEQWRHKRAAHFEMNAVLPSLIWDELDPLLGGLQEIVRDTSVQSVETDLLFNTPNSQHIDQVMAKLSDQAE